MLLFSSPWGTFWVPESVCIGYMGQDEDSVPRCHFSMQAWLVSPSSCFVFAHRSTRSYSNRPHSHSHEPCRCRFCCFCAMLGFRETIQLLGHSGALSEALERPLWWNSTSNHFWGYCCFLEFSLGESILEKMDTVIEGMELWNVQSQQGRWNTFPPSQYVSPNFVWAWSPLNSIKCFRLETKVREKIGMLILFSFWLATSFSWGNGPGGLSCLNKKKVQRDKTIRRSEKNPNIV